MAVPTTTETRYGGGSVQARQGIQGLHKKPHPYIFFFSSATLPSHLILGILSTIMEKKRCRDGVTCVVLVYPVLPGHCHHHI